MRANIQLITSTLNCNEAHAEAVERYMDEGAMVDWSEASMRTIKTLARAVNEHLLRSQPAESNKKATTSMKINVKQRNKTPVKAKVKATPAGPKPGTKIAHAMVIYKSMFEGGVQSSRQDVISALEHSMQITRQQAAGYYQTCKKKLA